MPFSSYHCRQNMSVKLSDCFLLLSICLCWLSCANIMTPTGGPRDETAPLLKKRSMADSALNFKGGVIRFEFDEFVQLKDVQNQLVVTPLLKKNPRITVHKKRVTVDIDDSLLEPNTTYAVSMGNAIQDMRESNPYKDLSFTFSTGLYFDSLSLQGTVIEANTGKPDTSAMAVLYRAGVPDSAFFNEKPLYVQKLFGGSFFFKNLPDKPFRIFVLDDQNRNLRYDLSSERMAFNDQSVSPGDSTPIVLYSFVTQGNVDTSFKKKQRQNAIAVAKPAQGADKKVITRLSYLLGADTSNKSKRSFDLWDSVRLVFDHEIKTFDLSKISLFKNELPDKSLTVTLDSARKTISLHAIWAEDEVYKVILQKGFAQDSTGLQGNATEFFFRAKRKSDYGTLIVQCKKDENDILELMRNDKVIARKTISDTLLTFPLLLPDTYQVRLLHDTNHNGLWDAGSFFGEKKQPERTELFPAIITIKANWENKIDLKTVFLKKQTQKK
ncbi:hypothetical protein EMGBS15_15540 [Filimonas sp.]|nr:hypothetical protein EMGBS15_15540 [Filimonas sp.]